MRDPETKRALVELARGWIALANEISPQDDH
jgi:hypothetical protein